MPRDKAFCRVILWSDVEAAKVSRSRYEALIADKSLFFIVDTITGRVWRSVESGGLGRWKSVPRKQLTVLVELIQSGKGMTAAALGVVEGTVENARRLIEKPPKRRLEWRTIKTIRGIGMEANRFRFDPEKGLRWCLILPPIVAEQPESDDHLPSPTGVTLLAAGANYFTGDGIILVSDTSVLNRTQPVTVMKMELDVSVRDGTKVLAAGPPSGRYSAGEQWLWPTRFRLAASDGVSGALEFSAWSYGIGDDDIVEGSAILAATLGDGTRIEKKIDLRRKAA